jgi:hypothetical protein
MRIDLWTTEVSERGTNATRSPQDRAALSLILSKLKDLPV